MLGLRRLFNKPKLGDGRPLAVFYYCDIAVSHQMEELNHLMRNTPDNLDRRATLIRQLKEAQHNLMGVILTIAGEALGDAERADRGFRVKYPDDVLLDQINGPIWFGAECIAAGSHIANHEFESQQLRSIAIKLSDTISSVRAALREQCCSRREGYSDKLKELLADFDKQWANFEFSYVCLMCNVKSAQQYYNQQDIVVLFSEAAHRAVQKRYITADMIEMMDPSVMFAIPRLAIICGLIVHPHGPLDLTKSPDKMPSMFQSYRQLLTRIKDLVGYLSEEQLSTLERALCSAEGLGTLNRQKIGKRPKLSKYEKQTTGTSSTDTIITSSSTPSGPAGGATSPAPSAASGSLCELDSRSSTQTVFEPEPIPESTRERSTVSSLNISSYRHNLGVSPNVESNTADSDCAEELRADEVTESKSERSSSPSSSQLEPAQHPVRSSASSGVRPMPTDSSKKVVSQKRKGPGGFASTEDLMHRLYIAISGVADQLQTNHAKDFRNILKDVFAICQSEPEPLSPCKADDCTSPFLSEPHSPLITSESGGFQISVDSNMSAQPIRECPNWEPDSDCSICSACNEHFSWKKRKHHCRSCGHVVCGRCSPYSIPLPQYGLSKQVRVCTACYLKELGQILRRVDSTTQQPMQVY